MSKPDLHQRYRDYLSQFKLGEDFTSDESTWITVSKIKSLALGQGYSLDEIRTAIDTLKEDIDIALVWYGKDRTERICLYPMTEEERRQRREDVEWFDSLPG